VFAAKSRRRAPRGRARTRLRQPTLSFCAIPAVRTSGERLQTSTARTAPAARSLPCAARRVSARGEARGNALFRLVARCSAHANVAPASRTCYSTNGRGAAVRGARAAPGAAAGAAKGGSPPRQRGSMALAVDAAGRGEARAAPAIARLARTARRISFCNARSEAAAAARDIDSALAPAPRVLSHCCLLSRPVS
jgi:hypothetical protein